MYPLTNAWKNTKLFDPVMPFWHRVGMDLKHLRFLVAAVEEGTLHGAAKKLGIAQPAISRRIMDLEAAVGCDLLSRNVRGVRPTAAGRVLYNEALEILDKVTDAMQLTQRIGLVQGRQMRFGIVQTARRYGFIQNGLAAYSQSRSDLGVAITRGESYILANDLREDRLDATILYELQPGGARFGTRLIHRERYVLALHPSHRLAQSGPVQFDELSGEAFVWLMRRRGMEIRDVLLQHCRMSGFDPLIGQIANSPEELIDLVTVTGGICLTPASTALTVPEGQLIYRTVPQLTLELDLNLAWSRQPGSTDVEDFLRHLHLAIDQHQLDISQSEISWASHDGIKLVRTN